MFYDFFYLRKFIFSRTLASLICFLVSPAALSAQVVSGKLTSLANQSIRLEGFHGLNTNKISIDTADASGHFTLPFSEADYGVGYLISADDKPVFVILSDEDVSLEGTSLVDLPHLHTLRGKQNSLFERYAYEHPRREQALGAWDYLRKLYQQDTFFSGQTAIQSNIQSEISRIVEEDDEFLSDLPEGSYVKWFLPVRSLVSSVSTVVQYRTSEIPAAISDFRRLDYSDNRLYKSGLFKDAIDNHFWLLENCGKPLDTVFIEMKKSIDSMMQALLKDENKLNEVTDYLFDQLERRSLFEASEYLALKTLNQSSCTITDELAKQLETYRAMRKGNIAPDIVFKGDLVHSYADDKDVPKRLSDLKSTYTLIVFGAGWCTLCAEEIPRIAGLHSKWKKSGVEVVFISLDDSKDDFISFARKFPFISLCDSKKWEGEAVKDYYVFGTPTFFLLDDARRIVLRPTSVNQMDAWVDWYLLQSNPSLK